MSLFVDNQRWRGTYRSEWGGQAFQHPWGLNNFSFSLFSVHISVEWTWEKTYRLTTAFHLSFWPWTLWDPDMQCCLWGCDFNLLMDHLIFYWGKSIPVVCIEKCCVFFPVVVSKFSSHFLNASLLNTSSKTWWDNYFRWILQ